MRVSLFFISSIVFTAQMMLASPGFGQDNTERIVRLNFKNEDLANVLKSIQHQADMSISYESTIIKDIEKVSISMEKVKVADALNLLLKNKGLQWKVIDNAIWILPRFNLEIGDDMAVKHPTIFPSLDAAPPPITIIVRGTDGRPLAGVNVIIKGSKKGGITDAAGEFSIEAEAGDVLVISSIGYSTKEVKITSLSLPLLVSMEKSISQLDEVQYIAYGIQTKRLSVGNVTTVKAEEIEKQPVNNLQQALQGRVPGLEVSITNGNSMAPVKMEIRGRNSLNRGVLSEPLYVIDDIPFNVLNVNRVAAILNSDNPPETSYGMSQAGFSNTNGQNILSFINPKDIESIDVLKDADATSIYGSLGANGVIKIRTKRGKAGPAKFNLNINQGTLVIPKRLDLLSTQEYLAVRREAFENDKIIPTEENAIDLMVWDQTRYTDWQKVLYGTGTQTQVSAGISGGLQQTTYSINASYSTRKDLMNNNGKNENTSLKMNVDYRSTNQKFNVGVSTIMSLVKMNAFNIGGRVLTAPNAPAIYDETGALNFLEWTSGTTNYFPFSGLKIGHEEAGHMVTISTNIGYEVLKGLRISATAGYSFGNNQNERFSPLASFAPGNPFTRSNAFYGSTLNNISSIEPQISYTNYIGKGNFSVLAGGSLQSTTTKGASQYGEGYPDDNLIRSISNAQNVTVLEGFAEHKYTAAFARLSYNWANKYIINLNARRDGSSRFGPGRQFGNFGSAGLAWILTEESWMKSLLPKWISFLKLRSSYGSTGGNSIGEYQYLSRWSTATSPGGWNQWIPYGGVPGMLVSIPLNQDYRWESTKQLETAIEMSFFEDRVNVSAAYYRKRSGNQLTKVPTPVFTGVAGVQGNWEAFVQNSGFEFSANSKFIDTKDFSVSASFIFAINRNKLLDYPNIDKSPYATTYQIGQSLDTRYYLHYTGVDPLTGTHTFEDRNKDGRVEAFAAFKPGDPDADRYVPINLTPKYSGGFGFQVVYKQFGIDMYFMYRKQLGMDPFNTLSVGSMDNVILPDEVRDNRWQKVGDNALYPRYTTRYSSPIEVSDGAFADASFVKLGNLAISYDLPNKLISKIKMSSCRLSLQTRDLFYITSFKGPNPEVQNLRGVSPIPRLISSSLVINF